MESKTFVDQICYGPFMRNLILIAVAALVALPAAAQARDLSALPLRQLFALERRADDACRSPGQDIDGPACTRRERVEKELARRGWCWGPDGEIEANERWMRSSPTCHPES